ncbi:MAG: hypothetical protein H0X26_05675 [Alphaproteobacteria bacterium]|nr:hypothetical protein [Alphaproteobacteria bacterium]
MNYIKIMTLVICTMGISNYAVHAACDPGQGDCVEKKLNVQVNGISETVKPYSIHIGSKKVGDCRGPNCEINGKFHYNEGLVFRFCAPPQGIQCQSHSSGEACPDNMTKFGTAGSSNPELLKNVPEGTTLNLNVNLADCSAILSQ